MAYSDFTLEKVVEVFGLSEQDESLFTQVTQLPISDWLRETLAVSLEFALISSTEKSRSEFIIAPILLEFARQNAKKVSVYSGKRLNVDLTVGLAEECDFILSRGQLARIIQTPILALVEAKKQDIELGLGQCVAQMLGAQRLNQHKNNPIETIFGCVTTGEVWQFLKLQDTHLTIDRDTYYIGDLETVLGIFQLILDASG